MPRLTLEPLPMHYQDPYEHIAQLLMKHSLKTKPSSGGDRKSERRVSLGGEPVAAGERRVSLSMETYEHASEKKKVTVTDTTLGQWAQWDMDIVEVRGEAGPDTMVYYNS